MDTCGVSDTVLAASYDTSFKYTEKTVDWRVENVEN